MQGQNGKGKRISRDLRVEQLNKISKEEIRALGFPNINDESVQNATRATAAIEEMVTNSKADLVIEARSGHHCNKEAFKAFSIIFGKYITRLKFSALSQADTIMHFQIYHVKYITTNYHNSCTSGFKCTEIVGLNNIGICTVTKLPNQCR